MRKISLLFPMMAMLLSSCGNAANTGKEAGEQSVADKTGKVLVVYFSHAGDNYAVGNVEVGNTKKIADLIAEETGADEFEVVAEKNYDMPYAELTELAKQEQEAVEFPPFKGEVDSIGQYETVFVGGPVWWGTYPQVLFTFFSKYDLNGKTLIPFTTHEGSGLGRCVEDLQEAYPDATVKKGLAVRGSDAQAGKADGEVKEWLKELGF